MKTLLACLALVGVSQGSMIRAGGEQAGEPAVPDAELAAWVDRRVNEWQPGPEEKKFDEIGWARFLLDAERLAAENGRPIFWFTHDGKMGVGRC